MNTFRYFDSSVISDRNIIDNFIDKVTVNPELPHKKRRFNSDTNAHEIPRPGRNFYSPYSVYITFLLDR